MVGGWLTVWWVLVVGGWWSVDWLVGGRLTGWWLVDWLVTVSLCLQVMTLTEKLDENMRWCQARTHKVLGSRPSPKH